MGWLTQRLGRLAGWVDGLRNFFVMHVMWRYNDHMAVRTNDDRGEDSA